MLLPLLAGALLLPPRAAASPLSKARDQAELDALFGESGRGILHREHAGGRAPRFSLDLDAVPPSLRTLVDGHQALFHKNQGVDPRWVEHVNELIRAGNELRRHKLPQWHHVPGMDFGTYACLSFGASYAYDWWAAQLGREPPSYRSDSHGGVERGLNPRLLELEYFNRAQRLDPYYVLAPRLFAKDPMRRIAVPIQPRGYAELLIEDEPFSVVDPVTRARLEYEPSGVMEGHYVQLFTNRFLAGHTKGSKAKPLAQAFERWGIAYIQLEDQKNPQLTGSHTTAAIGFFCMQPGQGPVDCAANASDEDWARNTFFVIHDSFGDHPPERPFDAYGGPAYRAVQIGSVDQVIFFPHGLRVTATPSSEGWWRLAVTNKGGKPVEVLEAAIEEGPSPASPLPQLAGRAGDELILSIAARHYYEADGKPRRYRLRLADAPSEAEEIVRTPPSPTYRGRVGP